MFIIETRDVNHINFIIIKYYSFNKLHNNNLIYNNLQKYSYTIKDTQTNNVTNLNAFIHKDYRWC